MSSYWTKPKSKKYPHRKDEGISLVDPPRETWNSIFSDLQEMSERLELLGIDDVIKAGQHISSTSCSYL